MNWFFTSTLAAVFFVAAGSAALGTDVPSAAAPTCVQWLSKFNVLGSDSIHKRDFSRLASNVQPKDSMGIDLREIVPHENRIVIGIENRKHLFMVVGNVRFDGRIFHEPDAVVFESQIPVAQGIFLSLDDVPVTVVNHLKHLIQSASNEAYVSCVHAVFEKLKEAGITAVGTDPLVIRTGQAFDILAKGGLTLPGGQNIKTRLYRTPDVDPAVFNRNLNIYDGKVLTDIGRKFKGVSPEDMVKQITGQTKPVSPELSTFLLELTGSAR